MSTTNKYASSDPSSHYTSMEYEQEDGAIDKNGYPLKYHNYDPKSKDGVAGDEEEEEEEIYIVRQNWGYCSIFFSIIQTIILALMMWQCGVAPMNINPMVGPYPDALRYVSLSSVFAAC
jgi:hypothetical protein